MDANLEMQDARSLSTSVHTPKSGSTNDPAQKVCFSKNNAVDKKEKDKKVPSKSLNVTPTAPEAKLTTSASKKIANFLCAELSSLEHNIKSLEEVNHICLSKVAIQDEQMGKAQPVHSTIEVETVPALVNT
uniref:Uncharacterized protein n=1 Tax=Moniliophthora roreri TaxID=221103 RepID=A0A0W0FEQ9_MONRR